MNTLEFIAWAMGILFVGVPFIFYGIPCIIAAIVAWRATR
jgi:hypothetical protein